MKEREWGRAKWGGIYKWMNQWTTPPPPQSSPLPPPAGCHRCACALLINGGKLIEALQRRWPHLGGRRRKKNMAFTCCNYWRAAGPDWLVSFVSAAHRGPVEKLPPELGGGGGEVMDCALLASQPAAFCVFSLSPPKGAPCTWLPNRFFSKQWKNRKTSRFSVAIE